jgi:drug/metabolite transporter (DMT)-like permease
MLPLMLSSRTATTLGSGAIVLWASLASLTALRGPIPTFQTTAIALAIGGCLVALVAIARGRAALLRPTAASLLLGVAGLFGYHALYFAALKLAPPAEASLISSLWALFTVLFSGLLPGHRLRLAHVVGALLGLSAATLLVWDKLGASHSHASGLGFILAFACALVWSTYSVALRLLPAVPSESMAIACLITAALAYSCSLAFEAWTQPESPVAWLSLILLGIGPLGAAFVLWDIGMKRATSRCWGCCPTPARSSPLPC